jgi:transposase
MKHYVGLDVSCKTISVCILDETGQVKREIDLESTPASIHGFLLGTGLQIEKIGLESGSLTHYLTKGLRECGYEVHPMESRKMAAILATTVNKTDRNDARGIAEALRAGHYRRCVHRSDEAMNLKTVLRNRDLLVRQRTQISNSIRGTLRIFGIQLKKGRGKDFPERVFEAIKEQSEEVKMSVEGLLNCLQTLEKEIAAFDVYLRRRAMNREDAKILKSIDGIGDITALAFLSEIDDASRFSSSRDVAAYLGLTPKQYSSGETQKQGRISKQGSAYARFLLIEAATVMLTRSRHWSPIKAWGLKLMKKIGKKKAIVAVARKLAVTMHSMLLSETVFDRRGKSKRNTEEKAA